MFLLFFSFSFFFFKFFVWCTREAPLIYRKSCVPVLAHRGFQWNERWYSIYGFFLPCSLPGLHTRFGSSTPWVTTAHTFSISFKELYSDNDRSLLFFFVLFFFENWNIRHFCITNEWREKKFIENLTFLFNTKCTICSTVCDWSHHIF